MKFAFNFFNSLMKFTFNCGNHLIKFTFNFWNRLTKFTINFCIFFSKYSRYFFQQSIMKFIFPMTEFAIFSQATDQISDSMNTWQNWQFFHHLDTLRLFSPSITDPLLTKFEILFGEWLTKIKLFFFLWLIVEICDFFHVTSGRNS